MAKTTIREVADRAGYAVSTVSNVLNDVPGTRVSTATRQRIRDVAEELKYRPNRLAQSLRTQRTHLIGLLTDDATAAPHLGNFILGAQAAAAEADSLLVVLSSDGDPQNRDHRLDQLIDRQVDGAIYTTATRQTVSLPPRLRQLNAVLLNARAESGESTSVLPDEVGGARVAVEHLLAAGHRRIAFLTTDATDPAARDRGIGYRQALEVYDVAYDDRLVVPTATGQTDAFSAALHLLSQHDPPTAVFCFDDRIALATYQAATDLGLHIPDDLSVIGFDDHYLAEGLRPAMTCMRVPHYAMGQRAVQTLLANLEPAGEVKHVRLPCELIVRASTTSPPLRR